MKRFYVIGKNLLCSVFVSGVGVFLFLPFVVYDTGIRCVTEPCPSAETATLFQFLSFSLDRHVVDIDYYVPLFWFVLLFGIFFALFKTLEKRN